MVSPQTGYLLLGTFILVFGLLSWALSWVCTRGFTMNKTQYLVANRELTLLPSGFSSAATWIWAPALFVSAQKAYQDGWLGLFWFTVPNILCLLLFSWFATRMREEHPDGFTLSAFVKERYSNRVQTLYWFTLTGLTVCAFAVQLLAGGSLLAKFLNIPYWVCTFIMAMLPLTYSLVFGIRASIITDFVKMIFIFSLGLTLIPYIVSEVGVQAVTDGFVGKKGNADFWSMRHWNLFLSFGLPVSIGLLSGPFGDQSFWQRAFSTRKRDVGKSFVLAAFLFGLVPLLMGTLGFIAVGANFPISNPGLVNLEVVTRVAGLFGACVFFFLVMSAITSILDSKLCAISSIAGHDLAERYKVSYQTLGRGSMLFLTLGALLIANIPDLKVLHLFLFYGTVRATTFLPTIFLLLRKPLAEASVFYGILGALLFGLPVFAYGNFNGVPLITTCGSLLTLLFPLLAHGIQKTTR